MATTEQQKCYDSIYRTSHLSEIIQCGLDLQLADTQFHMWTLYIYSVYELKDFIVTKQMSLFLNVIS